MTTREFRPKSAAHLEKSHIENALRWLRSARESGLFKNAAMCDLANKDPDLAAIASLDEFRRIICAAQRQVLSWSDENRHHRAST